MNLVKIEIHSKRSIVFNQDKNSILEYNLFTERTKKVSRIQI